jgi:hypothetical protein
MRRAAVGRRSPLGDAHHQDQRDARRPSRPVRDRRDATLRAYHGDEGNARESAADQRGLPCGKAPGLSVAGTTGHLPGYWLA